MKSNKPGQITLSIIVVCGFFMILYYFLSMRGTLPTEHRELISGMIGAITMKFGTVLDWWFSSNVGSERTKELLAKSQPIIEDDCIELKDEVKK
jgi:hypothetical protein